MLNDLFECSTHLVQQSVERMLKQMNGPEQIYRIQRKISSPYLLFPYLFSIQSRLIGLCPVAARRDQLPSQQPFHLQYICNSFKRYTSSSEIPKEINLIFSASLT